MTRLILIACVVLLTACAHYHVPSPTDMPDPSIGKREWGPPQPVRTP